MSKVAIAATAAALLLGTAPMAFADGEIQNWSGTYVGAHGMWGQMGTDMAGTTNIGPWPDIFPGQRLDYDMDGFGFGAQLGVNWQAGHWVYGLELSGAVTEISGGKKSTLGELDDQYDSTLRNLAMLNARVGYAWRRFLPYVKFGVAGGNERIEVLDTLIPTGAARDQIWRSGYTFGGGLEYAWRGNWSLALEYDYTRFGNQPLNLSDTTATYKLDDAAQNLNAVSVKINYRFGS
ncbi:MAG: porin family protein [Alphaproteobacteria bacterium]|nr:porin family protein [Alphaproteobacteria bacterium]